MKSIPTRPSTPSTRVPLGEPAPRIPTVDFWSWREHAACHGQEELFYNSEAESKGVRRRKEAAAKEVCAGCPVRQECLDYAMESRELYGVWGGYSENERHRLAGRHRTV